jgi:NAD(P)-dependent dehydrogenase (short-subunit alcohol dehydrogenase family)
MAELHDKTVLITGGGQGIGRGIAFELAAAGADVFITHLQEAAEQERAQATVAELRSRGHRAVAIPMDVMDPDSIRAGLHEIFTHADRLDILVNNAGVMQRQAGLETPAEELDRCYAVNLRGIWYLVQELLPRFKARQSGKIINISSTAGRRGTAELPAYCASKAAVISLTQSMALALAPYDINVNAVCPGIVWTSMSEQFATVVERRGGGEPIDMQQFLEPIRRSIPLRRILTAEDIGHAVAFLASERARNITGQALNVDGGYVMS